MSFHQKFFISRRISEHTGLKVWIIRLISVSVYNSNTTIMDVQFRQFSLTLTKLCSCAVVHWAHFIQYFCCLFELNATPVSGTWTNLLTAFWLYSGKFVSWVFRCTFYFFPCQIQSIYSGFLRWFNSDDAPSRAWDATHYTSPQVTCYIMQHTFLLFCVLTEHSFEFYLQIMYVFYNNQFLFKSLKLIWDN